MRASQRSGQVSPRRSDGTRGRMAPRARKRCSKASADAGKHCAECRGAGWRHEKPAETRETPSPAESAAAARCCEICYASAKNTLPPGVVAPLQRTVARRFPRWDWMGLEPKLVSSGRVLAPNRGCCRDRPASLASAAVPVDRATACLPPQSRPSRRMRVQLRPSRTSMVQHRGAAGLSRTRARPEAPCGAGLLGRDWREGFLPLPRAQAIHPGRPPCKRLPDCGGPFRLAAVRPRRLPGQIPPDGNDGCGLTYRVPAGL